MLTNLDEFTLFFAAVAAFLVVIELGYRLAYRQRVRDTEAKDHVKALQAALLGLLALLLGFNFAMASSRFDARKALLQQEVDAIRTTWLRAQLLSSPQRQEVSELMKRYVGARIDFMRAGLDQERLDAAVAHGAAIEALIWKPTRATVADDSGGSEEGLFILSLNDMVDAKSKRQAALDNHVPEPVLYLLFTVAVGALGFIGYGYGLTGRRRHGSTAIFAILIALVLATILDFDRPRGGFIRVGEEGMLQLEAAFTRGEL